MQARHRRGGRAGGEWARVRRTVHGCRRLGSIAPAAATGCTARAGEPALGVVPRSAHLLRCHPLPPPAVAGLDCGHGLVLHVCPPRQPARRRPALLAPRGGRAGQPPAHPGAAGWHSRAGQQLDPELLSYAGQRLRQVRGHACPCVGQVWLPPAPYSWWGAACTAPGACTAPLWFPLPGCPGWLANTSPPLLPPASPSPYSHALLWLFDPIHVALDASFCLAKYATHAVDHWRAAQVEAHGEASCCAWGRA